jgi:LEA14-like dessication related protein
MTANRYEVMPHQRRFKWMVLLMVFWMFGGCTTLDPIVRKPTATFAGIQLTDADLLQARALLNFNIANPNIINIRASRITYDLKINGRNFVAGELDQGITLAGGSTSTLRIPVSIQYLDLFDSVAQLWQATSADYAFFGGFSVGPVRIPLQAHGSFELPKMPKMSLEAIRIENFSLGGAKLNCRLKVDNPNSFDLNFKRLEYDLNLGGTSIAHASTLLKNPIESRRTSVVNFGVGVSFAQLGRSVYQLLHQNEGDFHLNGAVVVDGPQGKEQMIPFDLNGVVPLER